MSDSASGFSPQLRDIVWAQMKPWRPWPGQIVEPPESDKSAETKRKNSFYILFFGSNNYGWVTRDRIWPFEEFKDKYSQNYKKKIFLFGVETAIKKFEAKKRGEISEEETIEEASSDNAEDSDGTSESSDIFPITRTPLPAEQKNRKRRFLPAKERKESMGESSAKKANVQSPPKSPFCSIFQPAGESSGHSKKSTETDEQTEFKRRNVGVLGLGTVGGEVTMSLLEAGHQVTVWNRTEAKCSKYVQAGAKKGESPGEVFKNCELTFVCVSSAEAVKYLIFKANGLSSTVDKGCNLVVLTVMKPESSTDIEDVIVKRGGRYLEAPVYRIDEGEPHNLTVLAAGDEGLFKEYESVFKTFATKCFFLGPTGSASKTALVLNSFMGSLVAGMAEALCVAERTGVSLTELMHVLSVSPLGSKFLLDKGRAMLDKDFTTQMPLQQVTEAMKDTLAMSSKHKHSMPIVAAASEIFVAATALNFGERDMSAVYMPARF